MDQIDHNSVNTRPVTHISDEMNYSFRVVKQKCSKLEIYCLSQIKYILQSNTIHYNIMD